MFIKDFYLKIKLMVKNINKKDLEKIDKWPEYRNNLYPKNEWDYDFDENYNLIRKK